MSVTSWMDFSMDSIVTYAILSLIFLLLVLYLVGKRFLKSLPSKDEPFFKRVLRLMVDSIDALFGLIG